MAGQKSCYPQADAFLKLYRNIMVLAYGDGSSNRINALHNQEGEAVIPTGRTSRHSRAIDGHIFKGSALFEHFSIRLKNIVTLQ